MPTCDPPAVYQLRIRLDRISPLKCRRLLRTAETSIAARHASIQTAFGWTDAHLHRCVFSGKRSASAYPARMSFADHPDQLRLAACRCRTRDRFVYEYNCHVPWRHEIRVEQILPHPPGQHTPACIGGARAAPPEACASPRAFLALRQQ